MALSRSAHQTITLGLIVVVMAALSAVLISLNSRQRVYNAEEATTTASGTTGTATGQRIAVDDDAKAVGRYTTYRPELIDDQGYEQTILFFTAGSDWCAQCQAFETAIIDEGVPEGIQILTVDFETADELKKQYQVTVQTTFVQVDARGQLISSWVGFAQDKSLSSIITGLNTQQTEG